VADAAGRVFKLQRVSCAQTPALALTANLAWLFCTIDA
jgi:hypothetical protein